MTWSLASYAAQGAQGFGVLREDGTLVAPMDLKRWASPIELLEDWAAAEGVLREADTDTAPAVDYDTLLPPLQWPRKVICAGVNYRKHMREMGGEIPAQGWRPFFFLKAPTTSVIGPRAPIMISAPARARYDWEAELAVIIGIKGKNILAERALAHVAGYCVANDVTARGYHKRDIVPAEAFSYDWFSAKSMEGSLPLGPGITPAFMVPDPQDLRLRLWVNGELQQDESTADMVCSVAELVAAASEVVTLEPGDVIATGTPSGVGVSRGLYLQRRRRRPRHHRRPRHPGEHRDRSNGGNIMIFVTHQLPVNVPGEPRLDRAAVWDGLVLKANNALPFVPSMTFCEVTERYGDNVFDRDIDFRGQRFTERITLEATAPGDLHPHRRARCSARSRTRSRAPRTTSSSGSASPSSSPASKAGRPRSRSTPTR